MNTPLKYLCVNRGSALLASAFFLVGIASAQTTPAAAPADVPENPFGPKPVAPTTPSVPTTTNNATPPNPVPANENFVAAIRQMLLQRFGKDSAGTLTDKEITELRSLLSGNTVLPAVTDAQAAAANRGPLFGLRPLIMRRFDKNGDGTLDAAELAEARKFFLGDKVSNSVKASDSSSLDSLRTQIIQHFSKKGDGSLDEGERAAAKAWLQQMINDLDKDAHPNPVEQKPAAAASSSSKVDSPGPEKK